MLASELLQLKLIKSVKEYFKDLSKSGIDLNISAHCYIPTFGLSQGHFKIKKKTFTNYFLGLFFFIKDFILISKLSNFEISSNKDYKKKKYKYMAVSWAKKSDFSQSGIYYDRYLGLDSKQKNILWLLLYSDKETPKKIKENTILIFQRKKFYNLYFLIKYIFLLLKKNLNNLNNIHHNLSTLSCYAFIINNFFTDILKKNKFKKIIFPFESQPFQNLLISTTRKFDKSIKIIGCESSIDAFPINNLYKKRLLDIFYVHSKAQKIFYKKYFGWPKNKIRHMVSLRYFKKKKSTFENTIFLPYEISNKKFFLAEFDKFLNLKLNKTLNKFIIKIHPIVQKSNKHIDFKNEIIKLITKHKNKFSKNSKIKTTICFGATSTAIEALEHDLNVIHIVHNPILESYSELLWPKIKIKKISDNILQYFLKEKESCISLRRKKIFLNI
jgi:hypothetical protein